MAYTAAQIAIEGVTITSLEAFELICRPGEHAVLKLGGYVEEDQGENILYELRGYEPLSVSVTEGEASTLLFGGVITHVKVTGAGQTSYIELEASSRSLLMDIQKKSRSFQDVSMTYGQLTAEIMKDYPQGDVRLSIADRPLEDIAVQYRETDWEFLKRMLSMLHAKVSCNQAAEVLQLYAGIPEGLPEQWLYKKQEVKKEMGAYDYWRQQGAEVADVDFLVYTVETEWLAPLFDQMMIRNETFLVRSSHCQLEKGLIHCTCELQKKQGMMEPRQYPMHLTGVALEGEIVDVQGEQVKVHLAIDNGRNDQDVYWFSFSTLSASPDGSGWYYMPEKGDQVRVYFPSKYTGDVIAISAVSTYDGRSGDGPDKMGVTSTKSLSNRHGQELSMGEDGLCLKCSGGSACLNIGNDGSISLTAEKMINISAQKDVVISSETDMVFHGRQTVALCCTKGGQIILQDNGNLYIKGTEVLVD